MNNHITDTNYEFNKSILEYDLITLDNNIFNIYNNTKEQVYHKFIFVLNELKYIHKFNNKNNSNIKFIFNNKTEKNKRFVKYIKDIAEHLKLLLLKIYPNMNIIYPWNENEYPYSLYLINDKTSIITDMEKNILDINVLNYDFSYDIIFELTNVVITKEIINNLMTYSFKFKFTYKLIKKNNLIDFLNIDTKIFNAIQHIPKLNVPKQNEKIIEVINENPIITTKKCYFDPKILLSVKNSLKKIN
jgi:hypothetical protein